MGKKTILHESERMKFQFKLVVLGDGGVGKTCLIRRFCEDEFFLDTQKTIGINFYTANLMARFHNKDVLIGLSIWDLGTQENFIPLFPYFIQGAVGILLCFDLFSYGSLINLKQAWWPLIKQTHEFIEKKGDIPIVLVGTKNDLSESNELIPLKVKDKEIQQIMDDIGCTSYYPSSSKTGENIERIFSDLVQNVLNERYPQQNIIVKKKI